MRDQPVQLNRLQQPNPPQLDTTPWHACEHTKVVEQLDTHREAGLSAQEASKRLLRDGPNALPQGRQRSAWARFAAQFNNLLIYVLLLAAAITWLLDHAIDSAVIVGVVLINALIGFVQEGKAESALDKIRTMLSPTAQVLRDGTRQEIDATGLVVGDIIFLAAGDKVPADSRLIETYSLTIEEAALTGESLGVEKSDQPVAQDAALGDRFSMAYSGTLVTSGQGVGVVVAVGRTTELGRISQILARVQALATPLTRKMEVFSKWLSLAILALSGMTFAFGYFVQDFSASEMFMAAVGIAVAAIPEGLPAIMTISLAIGVQRMARRRAIIRKLPVVEALGSVTVICSDKTGTLTRNEMAVQRVITAEIDAVVTGTGYSPHGKLMAQDGREIQAADYPVLHQLGRVASLCNDAQVAKVGQEWVLAGDPTEGALLSLAMKMDLHAHTLAQTYPRTDVLPFNSDIQFMATLHPTPAGEEIVLLKGAPERVLALCETEQLDVGVRPLAREFWLEKMNALAAEGMRVLAIADKPRLKTSGAASRFGLDEARQGGFRLLGLVGITDPPREEVIAAIARCHSAGIRVKMITGDHVRTAQAIGAQIGITSGPGSGGATLSGQEIDRLSQAELIEVVKQADVFARATPEHKLRLVQALQANGQVVSMTGDGVNDAPALKQADVGVAMGKKGTEAAKEAAEMVLADDNFASITAAVEEGRTVYDNIRKAIVFILPTNGGEAGMLVAAIALGWTLPITPVQILWVNMVTAVTLALAIAFEKAEKDIMSRPPRPPNEPLVYGFLLWRIALVSALMVIGCLSLFSWELARGLSLEEARTVAVNGLVMAEMVYLFNSRHLTQSVISREGLLGNPAVLWACAVLLLLQALLTYWPVMHVLFGTAALDAAAWIKITGFALVLFLLIELEKKFLSRHRRSLGAHRV